MVYGLWSKKAFRLTPHYALQKRARHELRATTSKPETRTRRQTHQQTTERSSALALAAASSQSRGAWSPCLTTTRAGRARATVAQHVGDQRTYAVAAHYSTGGSKRFGRTTSPVRAGAATRRPAPGSLLCTLRCLAESRPQAGREWRHMSAGALRSMPEVFEPLSQAMRKLLRDEVQQEAVGERARWAEVGGLRVCWYDAGCSLSRGALSFR
eukprot:scaffold3574_cov121-Isochrysis_galbana.AAC.12